MTKRDTQYRPPTRKQMAMSRKEREQVRWLYIGLSVVAILVALVLGYGLLQTYVFEPNAPVAVVGGQEITTQDYQDRVKYERFMIDQEFQQVLMQRQSLAQSGDPQLVEFLTGQYDEQANYLQQQRSLVGQNTLDIVKQDKLIELEAANRGLTVTDDEVTETIHRLVAGQAGGVTAASASETATARVEASATALMWTPTPTFTPSPTLTATGEITPTATPSDTPIPAPTPTMNVLDENTLTTQYTNWINTLSEGAGIDEAAYRKIIRSVVLQDKLQKAISDEVPPAAEQAHARHILVETEEEAQAVLDRLDAGEDFADLAAELSQDPGSGAQGGDLGFVPRGRFVEEFDKAVFTLPIGQVEAVQTQFGWHVLEVVERDVRELSPENYQVSQRIAFNNWLTSAQENTIIEDFWSEEKVPAEQQ